MQESSSDEKWALVKETEWRVADADAENRGRHKIAGVIYAIHVPSKQTYVGQTVNSAWHRLKQHIYTSADSASKDISQNFFERISRHGGIIFSCCLSKSSRTAWLAFSGLQQRVRTEGVAEGKVLDELPLLFFAKGIEYLW